MINKKTSYTLGICNDETCSATLFVLSRITSEGSGIILQNSEKKIIYKTEK